MQLEPNRLLLLLLALAGGQHVGGQSSTSSPQPEHKQSSAALKGSRCEYERGPWQQCQPDGYQERALKLKPSSVSLQCETKRIIKRECTQGCKYARGEWSPSCSADGLRTRVDKLVGSSSKLVSSNELKLGCEPERRVIKDCRRACHYIKSAWSKCADGFETRNLTLAGLPGKPAANCEPTRQIRRPCRSRLAGKAARKQLTRQQNRSNRERLNKQPQAIGGSTNSTTKAAGGAKSRRA